MRASEFLNNMQSDVNTAQSLAKDLHELIQDYSEQIAAGQKGSPSLRSEIQQLDRQLQRMGFDYDPEIPELIRPRQDNTMHEAKGKKRRRVKEAGLVYKGYPCTKDCSGHMAGYDWSERRGINNTNQCPLGNSNSWHEGCLSKGQGR